MRRRVAFTSITANYLPKARVLAHSVKRYAPEVSFTLVLLDRIDKDILRPDDPFDEILSIDDFDIDNREAWLFGHTVVETCTAIKGLALQKLLEADDERQVLYFDPDIVVLHTLDGLYEEFRNASILLTPHGIEPETELVSIVDNEISHLKYGVYNLGFVGVKNSAAGRRFARWWSERLHRFCFDDPSSGIFTDQRWVDLAPCFFDEVKILRNPAYNVATWNLTHRVVKGNVEQGFEVNGAPLVFYHFSGFDSGAQKVMLERYGQHSAALFDLRQWYIDACRRMGQDDVGALPWHYGFFDNGQPITKSQRFLYRLRQDLQRAFPNPFATRSDKGGSYHHWYEVNGAPSVSALEAQFQSPSPSDFRILVLALDKDPVNGRRLTELLAATSGYAPIRLVATSAALAGLLPFASDAEIEEINDALASRYRREELILKLLEHEQGDTIVVQLGTCVPPLWDLRLHWVSTSDPSVVTVSPLADYGVFSPGLEQVTERSAQPLDPMEVDKVVVNLNLKQPIDSPCFFADCFYFRRPDTHLALFYRNGIRCRDLREFSRHCLTLGLEHVVALNIFVGTPLENMELSSRQLTLNKDAHTFAERNALFEVRSKFAKLVTSADTLPSVRTRCTRRNLHIVHNWGGGLEGWLRSYCRADQSHLNLILRPIGALGALGKELALYADIDDPEPIGHWALPRVIENVATHNLTYKHVLQSILKTYGIDQIIVSSLIGHSLDVLKTERPTILVCHDYFPMHPYIYVRSWNLSGNRLASFSFDEEFARASPELFPNHTLEEAQVVNRAFRACISGGRIRLVAPSPSAQQIYLDLEPRLSQRDVTIISHGTTAPFLDAPPAPYDLDTDRLRVVVLGEIAPQKGAYLLNALIPRLAETADVYLIGCGLRGAQWRDTRGVFVLESYRHDDLVKLLHHIDPHVGLLLSDFAETFSYTLDELMALGIPPVVRRIGAFADRVVEGISGFFVEANVDAVLDRLAVLNRDRSALLAVRENLCGTARRTERDMVADYERLFALPNVSSRACFAASLPARAYTRLDLEPEEARATDIQEPVGPTRVMLPLAEESVVRQISNAIGYWPDDWCSPHLSVRLYARKPVRRGQLLLCFPHLQDGERARVAIRVNGRNVSRKKVRRGTVNKLKFKLAVPGETPFVFEIDADLSPVNAEGDPRQLAVLLRQITFL